MTIEGSFGMLVNKWAILQGPIKKYEPEHGHISSVVK
jgi:hypothetical protein